MADAREKFPVFVASMWVPMSISFTCLLCFTVVQAHIFLHPQTMAGRRLRQGQNKLFTKGSDKDTPKDNSNSNLKTLLTSRSVRRPDEFGSLAHQSLLPQNKYRNTDNTDQRRQRSNSNIVTVTEPEVVNTGSGITSKRVHGYGNLKKMLYISKSDKGVPNGVQTSKHQQRHRQKRAYSAVADRIAHGFGKRTLPSIYRELGGLSDSSKVRPIYSNNELLSVIEAIVADFRREAAEESDSTDESLAPAESPYDSQNYILTDLLDRYPGPTERNTRNERY